MFCTNCGKARDGSDKFCRFCGAPVHTDSAAQSHSGQQQPVPEAGPTPENISRASTAEELKGDRQARLKALVQESSGSQSNELDDPIEPDTSSRPRTTSNYFLAHWRGELSLAVSFWGNFILLNVILTLATLPFTDEQSVRQLQESLGIRAHLVVAFLVDVSVIAIFVWQVVGTWRSAVRRHDEGLRPGPDIVRVLIIFGVIVTGVRISESIPSYLALAQHTFTSRYGSYEVRVEGNQIVLAGGLSFGVTDAVRRVLDENPQVDTLVIDSFGGYVSEGQRLASLVSSRLIRVHAKNTCTSACVLVLAAGSVRSAESGTGIGLHRAIAMTDEDLESASIFESVARAGYPPEDFRRSMSAPSQDMWYVDLEKARHTGFLHFIGDSLESIDLSKLTATSMSSSRSRYEELLLSISFFAELRQYFPQNFERVLARFISEVRPGMSNATMIEKAREIGREAGSGLLPALLPNSGDEELIKFTEALIAVLRSMDPIACYEYSTLGTLENSPQAFDEVSTDTKMKLMESMGGLISSSQANVERVLAGEVEISEFFLGLPESAIERFPLLDESAQLTPQQKSEVCELMITMYSEATNLERGNAGRLLRSLYSG